MGRLPIARLQTMIHKCPELVIYGLYFKYNLFLEIIDYMNSIVAK